MYQQPAQQTGAQTFPSQQPAAASPQGHGPPPQPNMYQMPPGQPQPVFTGQPDMAQQGQPSQHYVPAGQPVQPVQFQGVPAQPPVDEDEDIRTIKINMTYLKSGLNGSRIFEFVFLSAAWPCVVIYSNRSFGLDGRANFFKDITIFCWVMVIIFQIVFLLCINKNKRYFRQPSYCTLISLGIQVILTILLITCTVSFTIRLVDLHKVHTDPFSGFTSPGSTVGLLYGATVCGFLASLAFIDDIHLLTGMYAAQRSKEIAAASVAQQSAGPFPQQPVGLQAQFPPQPLLTQ